MSKYTTELRFICEEKSGLRESVGYNDVNEVITKSRAKIFDFDYPIFDPAYKPSFEKKFLRHFYTREIATETYGLWKLRLESKLNEIMPYYNKLYESELLEFNPLYTHDIKTTGYKHNKGENHDDVALGGSDTSRLSGNDTSRLSGTDSAVNSGNDVNRQSGTDTRNSRDKTNTWDLYSDTPQGGVNGIQDAEDDPSLATNGYLTNARHVIGDTDGSTGSTTYGKTDTLTHGKTTNTTYGKTDTTTYGKTDTMTYGRTEDKDTDYENENDYWETVQGYMGRNPSKSLIEFRNTFLNIDMMVIEELEELFFQLW